MERLEQIQQTLSEIDSRVPNVLRYAFGLGLVLDEEEEDYDEDEEEYDDDAEKYEEEEEEDDDDEEKYEEDDDDDEEEEEDDEPRAPLRMDSASCYVPEPICDHDAHFFEAAGSGVLGVADGVGGYMLEGVDAGAFSRGLMASASKEVRAMAPGGAPICPYALLERAYDETVASGAPGASTAAILSLAGGRALRWANVGDSGFAVLRGGTVVHRSRPQQSIFNCPLQLAGNARDGDSITVADVGETPVREGDVVVVGTDGLFDNMFDADLEHVVRVGTVLGFSPKNMADIIAGIAFEMSLSDLKDSPFSAAHRDHRGWEYVGGKPDDITVVVAFIVSSQLVAVDKIEDDVADKWMDVVERRKMERNLSEVSLGSSCSSDSSA